MILINSLGTFAYPEAEAIHLNSLDFVREAFFDWCEPETRFFVEKTVSLGGYRLGRGCWVLRISPSLSLRF